MTRALAKTRSGAPSAGAALAIALAAACGDLEIEDRPLEGAIDGEPWTFSAGSAEVRDFDGAGGPRVVTSLYAETDEPCADRGRPEDAGARHLSWSVPAAEGGHELGTGDDHSVTFIYPQEDGTPFNVVATTGRIELDEISAEAVAGALVAEVDAENHASGTFSLARCDEAE